MNKEYKDSYLSVEKTTTEDKGLGIVNLSIGVFGNVRNTKLVIDNDGKTNK